MAGGVVILADNTEKVVKALASAKRKGLAKVALTAANRAKVNLTKNKSVRTGDLRRSITGISNDVAAFIGTNVFYGKYVELGTRFMNAKPYLSPAAVDHADEYGAILEECLKNA